MAQFKKYDEFVNEVRNVMVSGTSGRTVPELEHKRYELKKDIKDAKIGDYVNVTLPKGTVVHNLPGGVFAKHDSLKAKYCSGYKDETWNDKFGVSIRRTPETLQAIEDDSKILESIEINESTKWPDEVKGNDGIIWKKQREVKQSNRTIANYTPFYKGFDIDFGGHTFGSPSEMEKYIKSYIVSNNIYNKYKHIPETLDLSLKAI